MSITITITDTLRNLHEARDLHARLSGQLREAQQRHDADYYREIEGWAAVAALISTFETQVKALAHAIDPHTSTPGVTVKHFATMHYELPAALAWAQATRMALVPESLDVRAFEKIARASVGALDFVRYGEVLKATIASDLAKHLPPLADDDDLSS